MNLNKYLVEAALIFALCFCLIEIYYANNCTFPNEFSLVIIGILVIGIISFIEHFYDRIYNKLGRSLFELIIVLLCVTMISCPYIVHCCFPDTAESTFKKQCTNITCTDLNKNLADYEGKKIRIKANIKDRSDMGGSWRLIVGDGNAENTTVAVFLDSNSKVPNNNNTLLIYGIVYGIREFKDTNQTHPGVFAFYIDADE